MAKQKRPGAVTALAIVFIVFGALGLLSGCCGFIRIGMNQASAADRKLATEAVGPFGRGFNPPPAPDINDYYAKYAPGYLAYQILTTAASALASGALLVGGIGLLNLWPWARVLALAYAGYAALSSFATVVYSLIFLAPANAKFIEEVRRWQLTYRPPGRGWVYVVDDNWAYWGIPLTIAVAVLTLGFAGLIVLVLLSRSAALAFGGRPPQRVERDWEEIDE
jgi:hypothetical protein